VCASRGYYLTALWYLDRAWLVRGDLLVEFEVSVTITLSNGAPISLSALHHRQTAYKDGYIRKDLAKELLKFHVIPERVRRYPSVDYSRWNVRPLQFAEKLGQSSVSATSTIAGLISRITLRTIREIKGEKEHCIGLRNPLVAVWLPVTVTVRESASCWGIFLQFAD
jgi:hypothetical protein